MYDVIIVGGSFAGLAAAIQLRGHRVLLIDQRPIGTNQTSTCAMPLSTARMVGAECATQEVHETLTVHVWGRAIKYALRDPYVTFDYHNFCQAMLALTDADVWVARATGYANGTVTTTRGPVEALFVVDASGWQSLQRHKLSHNKQLVGYGMETELPVSAPVGPGLQFYFEKRIVRNGYAWVFPCGSSTRIGVCSFDRGVQLRPVLDAFLARFGLQTGPTHGGAMPIIRREPLSGDLFVVGDAAGQCLPLWAEGIRTAIYYSMACGQIISEALDGAMSAEDARARYAALVARKAYFQNLLLWLHNAIAWSPEWVRAAGCGLISWSPVAKVMVDFYLRGSGLPRAAVPSLAPVS